MEGSLILTTQKELTDLIQRAVSAGIKTVTEYLKISGEGKTTPQPKNCLIEGASKITGLTISTIRTKCHLGELPYFKPPGTKRLQFVVADLYDWMESGKVKTNIEMEDATNKYLISKKRKSKKKKS
jgi:hypothetical protein